MSHHHHPTIDYPDPVLIASADLPHKALDFLYGAPFAIDAVLKDIESRRITRANGHKYIRKILADIGLELTKFPINAIPDEVCSKCLPDYNNCHLTPQQCMTKYLQCVETCS